MGSTLTGQKIKDTYLGFIKTSDSLEVNASGKELTDGNGNDLNIFINTSGEIGFGSTPDYTIDAGSSTGAFRLPNGSTAQQPTGQTGLIRYNTTDSKLEYYDSSFKFIASENYVNTQINNLIDSSPAALDTLNEIAAALNDDPDFYNTINTLINTKQDTVTGAATTIVSSDLTVSRALISNASGKVAVSSVTDTELGYVSGVTSDIQTQIDAKYDKSGGTISGNATITGDLTVDTNTLYVDSTNNRVGVGTTSPSAKLDVNGTGIFRDQLNIDPTGNPSNVLSLNARVSNDYSNLVFRNSVGSANWAELVATTSTLAFETGGTERMKITSGGDISFRDTSNNEAFYWDASAARLGIGTDSPSDILDIQSDTSLAIRIGNSAGVNGYQLKSNVSSSADFGFVIEDYSGTDLYKVQAGSSGHHSFMIDGNEKMRIDFSGRVGIGATSINSKVQIEQPQQISGAFSNPFIKLSNSAQTDNTGTTAIALATSTADNYGYAISAKRGASGSDSDFIITHHNNSLTGTPRLVIDSSGRVGIGTDSPDSILHLQGDGGNRKQLRLATGSTAYWDIGRSAQNGNFEITEDSGDTYFTINKDNGNVGIGTTSPVSSTHIQDSENIKLTITNDDFVNNTTGTSFDVRFGATSGNTYTEIRSLINGRNAWGNFVLARGGGNVGIGTDSPSATLDIYNSQASGISEIARFRWNNGGDGGAITLTNQVGTVLSKIQNASEGSGNYYLGFYSYNSSTALTEQMRITGGGNVLIGTEGTPDGTSNYGSAFITGANNKNAFLATSVSTADELVRFSNSNGKIGSITTNGSATAYNTSSDYRLKENVIDMTGALDRVDQLEPKRFNFIADANKTVDGFLAHEVADIVPEAISGEKDAVDDEGNPVYQGIDQSKLVPLLVGAIKELRAEIETLKSQINP